MNYGMVIYRSEVNKSEACGSIQSRKEEAISMMFTWSLPAEDG